ncbi:MAG: GntR family transcriptional regulator [Acetobacteraceae bacterium]
MSIERSRSKVRAPGQPASLPGAILSALREAIVSGELAPAVRLSEVQLSRRFNTSRTPVREALGQLEREGFVAIVPHVGAYVRTITSTDVEDIYQIRAALEELAVSLLATRLTRVGEAQIAAIVGELEGTAAAHDPERFAAALDAFHLLIVHLSGNERLEQLYECVVGPIRRLRRINLHGQDGLEHSLQANRLLAEAIIAHAPAAPASMRARLLAVAEEVKEVARAETGDGSERGADPPNMTENSRGPRIDQ